MLLGSVLFVAGGWSMDGGWLRWLCVGFFGLGVVVSLACLLPGTAYLRLTPDGLTIRSLSRAYSYRWRDIDRFYPARIGLNRFVAVAFAPDFEQQRAGRKLATLVSSHEGALPDTYGMRCDELAELLNRCRERARSA